MSRVLIQAQAHKNMIDTIVNMPKTIDQSCPKRYAHVKFVGTPYDRKKKYEIDN